MKASIFISCIVDMFYPEVGESMVRVLRSQGVELDFPRGQICCGQPAWNTGFVTESMEVAASLVQAFSGTDHPIITPSGSCATFIRSHYDELFSEHPTLRDEAATFSRRVYEFSEFLVHVLGIEDIGAEFPARATYHTSCHMSRELGLWDEPKALLRHVRGLELVDLPREDECCGFGGTFAVKMEGISSAMVDAKVQAVVETGADLLIGSDMACLMNIGGRMKRLGKPVRVMHVAQVLDEGLTRKEASRDAGHAAGTAFHGI